MTADRLQSPVESSIASHERRSTRQVVRTARETRRPNVRFLGKTFAGWATRFANLQTNMSTDPRIRAEFCAVTGWRAGGRIERLAPLPASLRGRARAYTEAAAFVRRPRPDVTWTSALEAVLPYLATQIRPARTPLVLELDWTFEQQEALALEYFGRGPRTGMAYKAGMLKERFTFAAADRFVTMSRWTAEALQRRGIDDSRIDVIHPGLDLESWRPLEARERSDDGPIRVLFVGGDFARKGGPELLDVFQASLRARCELDIVTTAAVDVPPGVRVHRLGPNSDELKHLYREADLFVLPTRADCFGHAAVEASASGVPVVVTDVGGTSDIVEHSRTGWLIGTEPGELAAVLEVAISSRRQLREMGIAARARAERLFDGPANDRRLADILLSLAAARQRHPA